VSHRPYLPAIQTLQFCQRALSGPVSAKERRVLWRVHRWAVATLDQLEREHAALILHAINSQCLKYKSEMPAVKRGRGPPRNVALFEQGQTIRAEIRSLLVSHPSTSKPLEAKQIQPILSRRLAIRTVQWHMESIRNETTPKEMTTKMPDIAD